MTNMQKNMKLLLSGIALLGVVSCDKDHDDLKHIPQQVQTGFSAKYPAATRVEWEKKGEFVVADFWQNQIETEAWFDQQGIWQMSEQDIRKTDLPAAVLDSFGKSSYALWRIDDLDLYERKDFDPVYVIEVEKGETDVTLLYAENGTLIKELVNVENDQLFLPASPVDQGIKTAVNEMYPEAKIVEIERERNTIEVEIIHENRLKEVVFDTSITWLYSSWDLALTELPDAVKQAVQTQYPNNRIDEADFVETPQQSYYLVEIEPADKDIKITPEGQILP